VTLIPPGKAPRLRWRTDSRPERIRAGARAARRWHQGDDVRCAAPEPRRVAQYRQV